MYLNIMLRTERMNSRALLILILRLVQCYFSNLLLASRLVSCFLQLLRMLLAYFKVLSTLYYVCSSYSGGMKLTTAPRMSHSLFKVTRYNKLFIQWHPAITKCHGTEKKVPRGLRYSGKPRYNELSG